MVGSPTPAGEVTCVAPPNAAALGESLPFSLSLNAQQFSAGDASFRYTAEWDDETLSVTPGSGPVGGGTLLVWRGADLGGGAAYACRFTRAGVAAVAPANASLSTEGSVRCIAPPLDELGSGPTLVWVSPNSQQWFGNLSWSVFDSPSSISATPASAPSTGGTLVRF